MGFGLIAMCSWWSCVPGEPNLGLTGHMQEIKIQKTILRIARLGTVYTTAMIIYENYKSYTPPRGVKASVEKLLAAVPKEYLGGLESIVLTNSGSIGKGMTRRVQGRKYRRQSCAGFYHPRYKGNRPWIEILVDNALGDTPRTLLWIPIIREGMLSGTLFHELGHHLDATVGAPAPTGEAAAEAWNKRLSKIYFQKRYWYILKPLSLLLAPFTPFMRNRVARAKADHERKGCKTAK